MTPITVRYFLYKALTRHLGNERAAPDSRTALGTEDMRPEWATLHSPVPGEPVALSVCFADPYYHPDDKAPKFRKFRITVEEID